MPANVSWFDFKCYTLAPALWLDNKTENQQQNLKKEWNLPTKTRDGWGDDF